MRATVTTERSRRSKFAEPVADHIFGDKHFQVLLAIVHHKRVTDELRHNRAGSAQVLIGSFLFAASNTSTLR